MAKLYWRVKINNVWTWQPANDENTIIIAPTVEAIVMHHGVVERFNNLHILEEEE